MDLSLHDALTDGKPQLGADSMLKRDFVASLEAESFDDKVKETVGKTDYRPLLDGPGMMSGGQTGAQGEKRPCPTGQVFNTDFLSSPVSMVGMPDQWGSQHVGSKMQDRNIQDSLLGFTQSEMMQNINTNLNMGAAPFQTGNVGASLKPSPLFATEAPKLPQAPMKATDPYPSAPPYNTQEKTAAKAENEKQEKTENLNTNKLDKADKIHNIGKNEKDESIKKDEKSDKTQIYEKIVKDNETVGKDNKTEKTEKAEKVDKPEKMNKDEKMEKKENCEKTDKMVKGEKNEKAWKGTVKSPTTNGGKELASPDGRAKVGQPAVGSTKPSAAKTRPSSLSTGEQATPPKRPSPMANKKSPVPKATTPGAGTKRSITAASRTPTATTPHDHKAKTLENGTSERRPPVPKVPTSSTRATGPKNGTSTPTPTKPVGSTRMSSSAPSLRRNTVPKTDIKPGDMKKPSTLKTTPGSANSTRTKPTRAPATAPSTPGANGEPRRRITKPPVPKQTVPERKPPVPRAPRSTPRPINAPIPDLKNVRSKIGSTDNIKYQPGGGKVSSTQGRTDAQGSLSKEPGQGKVPQIVHKKLDFSHITSRCGSKDNIKHVPGGGNVQILNKKVDLSKVTSKCGSKDNIKHKPGGGDVKIPESNKANLNAKSKVGSMDNVGHEPEVGQTKAQEKADGKTPPLGGVPATVPGNPAPAKENGVKEVPPVLFGGDSLRDPMGLDKRIPETN